MIANKDHVYTTVLIDIDGTLVDSNDAHTSAWVQALGERGVAVLFERVRPLIGMGGDKLLATIAGIDSESDEGRAISARRKEIFQRQYVPTLKATPGARPLLERLKNDGVTLAIATSAEGDEVEALLRVAGVDNVVDLASSSDDAEESKPDPDIVQAALRRAGARAADALMIGDTPYDIEAAQRAGVGTIALRCGGWWSDEALAGALAIYDDPQALLAHYDRSLFARRVTARSV
jgi:HAD superfamily hydrolase (TIGR01509 family)